ncbi:hypothetical protein P5673_023799 [Acropora cervicornis]|uniref:Uncharacterized protein n=1 Tax=Acropora cervicornis TaxID=6130 RepID=A0AAD9Q575_ACRCE|nr:hypothetical protein P5673_023799 [Acropora cervicornis]
MKARVHPCTCIHLHSLYTLIYPCKTLVHPCTSLYTLVYLCTPLYTRVHSCIPLFTPVNPLYSFTPLHTLVHPCTPLYTLVYACVPFKGKQTNPTYLQTFHIRESPCDRLSPTACTSKDLLSRIPSRSATFAVPQPKDLNSTTNLQQPGPGCPHFSQTCTEKHMLRLHGKTIRF